MSRSALVAGCLTLLVLTLAGCGGSGGFPTCDDSPRSAAELAGSPTFSAAQIAPGDPLSLRIPVSEETRQVTAFISAPEPTAPRLELAAETEGSETVVLPIDTTDLLDGTYTLSGIFLRGENPSNLPQNSIYDPQDPPNEQYVLNITFAAEQSRSCVTDIPVATFDVVSEVSAGR